MSEDLRLDWSAAEVHDGTLTVPLAGEHGKSFKRAFKSTVRLLGEHPGWGEVELHKSAVQVNDVEPGTEDPLRHHLDSIVIQAAATVAAEEAEDEPSEGETAEPGPDAEMTARFRSFADAGDESAADADR
jgi:hypothetical protein